MKSYLLRLGQRIKNLYLAVFWYCYWSKFFILIRRLLEMGMSPSGSQTGVMGSNKTVYIKKEVFLDDVGNEIFGTAIYKVIDQFGNELKTSTNIKEIFAFLDENVNTLTYKS